MTKTILVLSTADIPTLVTAIAMGPPDVHGNVTLKYPIVVDGAEVQEVSSERCYKFDHDLLIAVNALMQPFLELRKAATSFLAESSEPAYAADEVFAQYATRNGWEAVQN